MSVLQTDAGNVMMEERWRLNTKINAKCGGSFRSQNNVKRKNVQKNRLDSQRERERECVCIEGGSELIYINKSS
jgi:hypothetical protein